MNQCDATITMHEFQDLTDRFVDENKLQQLGDGTGIPQ